MNYWIFDFDGVLARSIEDEILACRTFQGLEGTDDYIHSRIRNHFSKIEFDPGVEVDEEQKRKKFDFMIGYTEYVMQAENRVFSEFIDRFASTDTIRRAIVSGGSQLYIKKILQPYLNSFDGILSYESSLSKRIKVDQVANQWSIPLQSTRYFTDTNADVLELKDHIGLDNIYGCAWGWCGYEMLSQVLPKAQILRDFADIERLL